MLTYGCFCLAHSCLIWLCCAAGDLKTRAAAAESSVAILRQQVKEGKQKAAQKKIEHEGVLTRSKKSLEKAREACQGAQEHSAECESLCSTQQRACLLLHGLC